MIPGSGYAYLGMWQTALLSFSLTAISALAAREQFLDRKPITGLAIATVGSVFYLGGAFGANHSAYDLNHNSRKISRERLRSWALPELMIEWNF